MKDSTDWIKFVDDHIECQICGAIVERGIISVTDHWSKCHGKETMEAVNKIADMPLYSENKLGLIKQILNIEQ